MFWDIVLKNIRQRRLRSILTILGVAAAVQLYLTMSAIMRWYDQDLQAQLRSFAGKVVVQRLMSQEGEGEDFPSTNSSFSAETASAILSLESIQKETSSATLFVSVVRALRPFSSPRVMAVGIEPGHEAAYIGTLKAARGQATLTSDNEVILGYEAALYYGGKEPIQPGQTVEMMGQNLTVVGVLDSSSALLGGAALMPLATAQQLFGRTGTVSAVILTAAQIDKTADLQAAVEARFPDLQSSGQGDISRSAEEVLVNARMFFRAINVTVVLVAIVVIMIVMIVAVMERRREIGTLRAIGARRRVIFSMVVGESLMLSLVGVILAMPLTAFANNLFFGYFLSTEVFLSWLKSFWVAILIGILAALLPAWQAVRVDPLEALRYE